MKNFAALTCEQARRTDQIATEDLGIPGIVLMENAGRGAAEKIHQLCAPGQISILCGKGNNGGDGYVVARHLQCLGREVQVFSVCAADALSGDARVNADIAAKMMIPLQVVTEDSVGSGEIFSRGQPSGIVDGLLGTGAKPPLQGAIRSLVVAANAASVMRFALDIPTGLDGDQGDVGGEVFSADHTLTFVAPKVGFDHENAARYLGTVHVIGIGVPFSYELKRQLGWSDRFVPPY